MTTEQITLLLEVLVPILTLAVGWGALRSTVADLKLVIADLKREVHDLRDANADLPALRARLGALEAESTRLRDEVRTLQFGTNGARAMRVDK